MPPPSDVLNWLENISSETPAPIQTSEDLAHDFTQAQSLSSGDLSHNITSNYHAAIAPAASAEPESIDLGDEALLMLAQRSPDDIPPRSVGPKYDALEDALRRQKKRREAEKNMQGGETEETDSVSREVKERAAEILGSWELLARYSLKYGEVGA